MRTKWRLLAGLVGLPTCCHVALFCGWRPLLNTSLVALALESTDPLHQLLDWLHVRPVHSDPSVCDAPISIAHSNPPNPSPA
jgi:hypothetical protein